MTHEITLRVSDEMYAYLKARTVQYDYAYPAQYVKHVINNSRGDQSAPAQTTQTASKPTRSARATADRARALSHTSVDERIPYLNNKVNKGAATPADIIELWELLQDHQNYLPLVQSTDALHYLYLYHRKARGDVLTAAEESECHEFGVRSGFIEPDDGEEHLTAGLSL